MEKIYRVYKYPNVSTEDNQWLKVVEKRHVEIIKNKKYAEHGDLVDTKMAGNGYHGRCKNCGMPLVTDLGYMSWEDTVCEVKREEIITITYKLSWSKKKTVGTLFNIIDATKHFKDAISAQGWGEFNFGIKTNKRD